MHEIRDAYLVCCLIVLLTVVRQHQNPIYLKNFSDIHDMATYTQDGSGMESSEEAYVATSLSSAFL